jgi:hypothetical protein
MSTTKAPGDLSFRGSIARPLTWLSTLRREGRPSPRKTRFWLLARLCQAGLATRRVPTKGFRVRGSSSFPKLSWRKDVAHFFHGLRDLGKKMFGKCSANRRLPRPPKLLNFPRLCALASTARAEVCPSAVALASSRRLKSTRGWQGGTTWDGSQGRGAVALTRHRFGCTRRWG